MNQISSIKYSIIFLLESVNNDFPRYLNTLVKVFDSRNESFEIIIVAKGTAAFIKNLYKKSLLGNEIKVIEINRKATQAICIKSALNDCNGEILVVCGTYQHISSSSYEHLIDALNNKTDIVTAWRHDRVDTLPYRIQYNLFHLLLRKISGINIHDISCNVCIVRRKVIEKTMLYGDMYRYLPVYASRQGFKHREVKCEHYRENNEPRPRRGGLYYFSTYFNKKIDFFTMFFMTYFSRKPLRFFISSGFYLITFGILANIFIFSQKLLQGHPLGNRPILLLSIFFMVFGVQLASIGLLGEIIVFVHRRRNKDYEVEKVI